MKSKQSCAGYICVNCEKLDWVVCSCTGKWGRIRIVFFRNYTELADLAFLYCFEVKNEINSAKSLPPMGIRPATLGL